MAGPLSAGVMKSYNRHQRKKEEPLGQSGSAAEPSIHGNNSSSMIVITGGEGGYPHSPGKGACVHTKITLSHLYVYR